MNIGNNVEKLFISADNVKDRADKLLEAIYKEFDVSDYEELTDVLVRDLCEKIKIMRDSIENYHDFVVENDL